MAQQGAGGHGKRFNVPADPPHTQPSSLPLPPHLFAIAKVRNICSNDDPCQPCDYTFREFSKPGINNPDTWRRGVGVGVSEPRGDGHLTRGLADMGRGALSPPIRHTRSPPPFPFPPRFRNCKTIGGKRRVLAASCTPACRAAMSVIAPPTPRPTLTPPGNSHMVSQGRRARHGGIPGSYRDREHPGPEV